MYKVIKYFTDLQDHDHPYYVGDEFPRVGMVVSAARLSELASSSNKQGVPLIELVVEKTAPAEPETEPVPEQRHRRGRKSK